MPAPAAPERGHCEHRAGAGPLPERAPQERAARARDGPTASGRWVADTQISLPRRKTATRTTVRLGVGAARMLVHVSLPRDAHRVSPVGSWKPWWVIPAGNDGRGPSVSCDTDGPVGGSVRGQTQRGCWATGSGACASRRPLRVIALREAEGGPADRNTADRHGWAARSPSWNPRPYRWPTPSAPRGDAHPRPCRAGCGPALRGHRERGDAQRGAAGGRRTRRGRRGVGRRRFAARHRVAEGQRPGRRRRRALRRVLRGRPGRVRGRRPRPPAQPLVRGLRAAAMPCSAALVRCSIRIDALRPATWPRAGSWPRTAPASG